MLNSNEKEYEICKIRLLKMIDVLACNDDFDYNKTIDELEFIYLDGEKKNQKFKHKVSDIYAVLIRILHDKENGTELLERLLYRISEVRERYINNNNINNTLLYCIDRFYDHVSIDVQRIRYIHFDFTNNLEEKIINNKGNGIVEDLKKEVNNLQNMQSNIYDNIEETEKTAENLKFQFVAILGIFSSIIISFVGGATYSTSVLQYMHLSSSYRVVIVSLIIGFVFITVIFGLLYFLNSVISNKRKFMKKDSILGKFGKNDFGVKNNSPGLSLLIVYLIAVVVIVVMICFAYDKWKNGCVEARNERIFNNVISTNSVLK